MNPAIRQQIQDCISQLQPGARGYTAAELADSISRTTAETRKALKEMQADRQISSWKSSTGTTRWTRSP
jgi:hypothetical protein